MPTVPLVTALIAVHDGESYVRTALASILGQTVSDLEVVVVDDASTDRTPELLAGIRDPRLCVIRNEERLGLAGSLNRGLDATNGTFVARLDADDVAMPRRLERQLARIRSSPRAAVIGCAVLELDAVGRIGSLHTMPAGASAVRWSALFSSPFLHPTVLVERAVLDRHALRYDSSFEESEDHELWSRVLEVSDGDNTPEPLVLYRIHPHQASRRRRGLQRDCQLRIARRLIAQTAPALSEADVELAWLIGAGEPLDATRTESAIDAYVELVAAFESRWGSGSRERAARDLMRVANGASGAVRVRIAGHALRLDPGLPLHVVARRRERRRGGHARHEGQEWLRRLGGDRQSTPIKVAAVFPEPTPYRAPLLDRVATHPDVDLSVVYAAETVAGRTWRVQPTHRAVYLRGVRVPGAQRILHHDYPVTLGVVGALTKTRPDVLVVSGWSTFAAQAAIAWCGLKDVPYVLVVESHDDGPRAGWRRTIKGAVVPPVVRRAAGILVTGTLARDSMIARGAAPERVHLFANTIDVDEFGARADGLRERRREIREGLGAQANDVVVLSVARLGPEKRIDALVRAIARANDSNLLLVVAGDGPERRAIEQVASDLGTRLVLLGDVEWDRVVELYVAADIFALLSARETWAVVVNEAAACGLPLVLSDRIGAAHDLLRDGENGILVPAGAVEAAAGAFRDLAADAERRHTQGARSRELARDWGYGPSVEGFLDAVREAVTDRG